MFNKKNKNNKNHLTLDDISKIDEGKNKQIKYDEYLKYKEKVIKIKKTILDIIEIFGDNVIVNEYFDNMKIMIKNRKFYVFHKLSSLPMISIDVFGGEQEILDMYNNGIDLTRVLYILERLMDSLIIKFRNISKSIETLRFSLYENLKL